MSAPAAARAPFLVRQLHRLAPLRRVARRVMRGVTLRQRYHGGIICLDAVEHSWAWTGSLRYETFDRELQDALLALSRGRATLLDVGCNIGAMTLTVLLRNPGVRATSVDANARAVALLRQSLRRNGLEGRARVIEAAAGPSEGTVRFDGDGSVIGHVAETGREVPSVSFARLVDEAAADGPCLVKLDVEGFESALLPLLADVRRLPDVCLVVELHPLGLNGMGDPARCLGVLRGLGADIRTIHGEPVGSVRPGDFTNVVCTWKPGSARAVPTG